MGDRSERWRGDTPAVTVMTDHLRREAAIGGYEAAAEAAAQVAAAYEAVGELIGAAPSNIALVESATDAFARALAAFDFEPGDVLVTTRNDYNAHQLTALSLAARRGVRVLRADDAPDGGADPDSDRALERGDHPAHIDIRSATWTDPERYELQPDARRFETWEHAYALVLGMGEAVRYALDIGVETARDRAWTLARHARDRLADAGLRVLDQGATLCAIVTVDAPRGDAAEVVDRLRDWGINTSAVERSTAVLDMDAKQASSALRISPHYYNTDREMESTVDAVADLLGA